MKTITALYAKNPRDVGLGSALCLKRCPEKLPTLLTLANTHAAVWSMTAGNATEDLAAAEVAFTRLNGYHGPNPLANPPLQEMLRQVLTYPHTSMSVGDVIVIVDDGGTRAYLCDGYGASESWTRIPLHASDWITAQPLKAAPLTEETDAETEYPGDDAHVVTDAELTAGAGCENDPNW